MTKIGFIYIKGLFENFEYKKYRNRSGAAAKLTFCSRPMFSPIDFI
jgi:hypothetical protein